MKKEELLNLEHTQDAIKKIDQVLKKSNHDNDYFLLLQKKAYILNDLSKVSLAVKLLSDNINNSKTSKQAIILFDTLIDLCLLHNDFEKALNYINHKKTILDFDMMKLYNLDMVNYYYKMKNKSETKRYISIYLDDDLQASERIKVLELLKEYYYEELNTKSLLEVVNKLEILYEELFLSDKINDVIIDKVYINFNNKDYDLVINESKDYLNNLLLTDDQTIRLATILINAYLLLDNTKAAYISETNYEQYLKNVSDKTKLSFCKVCYEVYEKEKNQFMQDHYYQIIEDLEKKLNIEQSKRTIKFQKIEFTDPNDEYSILDSSSYGVKTKVVKTEINISLLYEKINQIIDEINNLSKTTINEVLRVVSINLQNEINIKEIVLIYNLKNNFKGFHIKQPRVYNKSFNIEDLQNSIEYYTYMNAEAMYIEDVSNSIYNHNVITKKRHEENLNALSIPLLSKMLYIGSITYYFTEVIVDNKLKYELLNILTRFINNRLNFMLEEDEYKLALQKYKFLKDECNILLKEEINGFIYPNEYFINTYSIDKVIREGDYISLINLNDQNNYIEAKKKILEDLNPTIIKYHITLNNEELYFKEYLNAKIIDNNIYLYGVLFNINEEAKKQQELKEIAFMSPTTNISSMVKLFVELEKLKTTNKFSLAVINCINLKKYNELYGYDFGDDLVYLIGQVLNTECSKLVKTSAYHLHSDKFAILFENNNDKRFVSSKTLFILEQLSIALKSKNKRLDVKFSAGIYKSSSFGKVLDSNKVLSSANEALYSITNEEENTVVIYDEGLNKDRYYQEQLTTHISEAIDHSLLAITYEQIVDIKNLEVFMYNAKVNLNNYIVDDELFKEVVIKKNLYNTVIRYLISNTFSQMKTFYQETKFYFKVMISIEAFLFENLKFYSFLETQLSFYKINPKNVLFLIESDNNSIKADIYNKLNQLGFLVGSKSIDDMINELDFDYYFYDTLRYDLNQIQKFIDLLYVNQEIIICNLSDVNEVNKLKNINISYVCGDCFKKKFYIKDLIKLIKDQQ